MNTERAHGHWSDRFTKEELAKLLVALASKRASNGNFPSVQDQTLLRTAASVLAGHISFYDVNLADEVDAHGMDIAWTRGAYDDAAILGDAADALREIEEEFATNMNLPLRAQEHDGTCEHGHPNCTPVGDKCGDECE